MAVPGFELLNGYFVFVGYGAQVVAPAHYVVSGLGAFLRGMFFADRLFFPARVCNPEFLAGFDISGMKVVPLQKLVYCNVVFSGDGKCRLAPADGNEIAGLWFLITTVRHRVFGLLFILAMRGGFCVVCIYFLIQFCLEGGEAVVVGFLFGEPDLLLYGRTFLCGPGRDAGMGATGAGGAAVPGFARLMVI